MKVDYVVTCKCGFRAEIKYGRVSKDEIFEVFSCKKCKNLFSVKATERKVCTDCGSDELVQYVPNKKRNIRYYDKMLKEKMLSEKKHKELKEYWKSIKDYECPVCKGRLEWKDVKTN